MADQSYPKRCADPTRNEMLSFLCGFYPGEAEQFDWEEAIYWFAHDWHGGQASNLYSALSTSPFHPGPLANGPEPGGMGEMLYQELEAEFVKGPTCQIQWIDACGSPTPDCNPSIGRIRTKDRIQQIAGRGIRFAASPWFHVCKAHAKQMQEPGMEIWEWESER